MEGSKFHGTTNDPDYLDMGRFGTDGQGEDKSLTPTTKYMQSSSKMLVELRRQLPPASRLDFGIASSFNDENDAEMSKRIPINSRSNIIQDENKNMKNNVRQSPEILKNLRRHRAEATRVENARMSGSGNGNTALNNTDFSDYLRNVRNNMNVTQTLLGSTNIWENTNTDHNALAESGVDYGSPGSFSDRAKAFSKEPVPTPKGKTGQVRR